MVVRLVIWSLVDSDATIESLRDYLRDESVPQFETVPGLLFKAWFSDEATDRWGAFYVWESLEAAEQQPASRARDSQLGAWASDQSRPLDGRATFEARLEDMKRRFDGQTVPRPPHWRGFRVVPERIEYWMDRPHRLHERRLFTRSGDRWSEGMLYP